MTDKRQEIIAIFKEHNVEIRPSDFWAVQGTPVVNHKALERLAAGMKIRWDEPKYIRHERDEAVIEVKGRIGFGDDERMEWSIGEALIGVNYRVSGKQAAYVYAMAEKRAKDRVILKLAKIEAYSEEEADEFKEGRPRADDPYPGDLEARHSGGREFSNPPMHSAPPVRTAARDQAERARPAAPPVQDNPPTTVTYDDQVRTETALNKAIDECDSPDAVTAFMLSADTQKKLEGLSQAARGDVRAYATARMKALGWGNKTAAQA